MDATVVGLQRTGTNYLAAVLGQSRRFNLVSPFWKHSMPTDYDDGIQMYVEHYLLKSQNTKCIVVVRHPIIWLESIRKRTPADLFETRTRDLVSTPSNADLIDVYNEYYKKWYEFARMAENVYVVNYERCLTGDFSDIVRGRDLGLQSARIPKVPESPTFSDVDLRKNLNFRTSLTHEVVTDAIQKVDPSLLEKMRYSQIVLSFEHEDENNSLRDLLYLKKKMEISESVANTTEREASSLLAAYPDEPFCQLISYAVGGKVGDEILNRAFAKFATQVHRREISSIESVYFGYFMLYLGRVEWAENALDVISEAYPHELPTRELYITILIHHARGLRIERKFEQAAIILRNARDIAIAGLRDAIEIDPLGLLPKIFEQKIGEALIELAYCQLKDNPSSALLTADEAINYCPKLGWAYHVKAEALAKIGHLPEALSAIRMALEAEPHDVDHSVRMGILHQEIGNYASALTHFETAVTVAPSNPWNHYHLAKAHRLLGDLTRAKESANMARFLNPAERAFSDFLKSLDKPAEDSK